MESYWIRVRPNLITGIPYKKRDIWTHTQRTECHMKTDTKGEHHVKTDAGTEEMQLPAKEYQGLPGTT